jgi:transcriptional regulator with XRE-family HTH domain
MNRDDQKRLGDRIRELRRERGLTQEELGARAKVSKVYVSRVEKGNTDIGLDIMKRIAEALDVSPATLFGELVQLSRKAIEFGRAFDEAPPELQAAILNFLGTLNRERGKG